jgi:hypothetical protein
MEDFDVGTPRRGAGDGMIIKVPASTALRTLEWVVECPFVDMHILAMVREAVEAEKRLSAQEAHVLLFFWQRARRSGDFPHHRFFELLPHRLHGRLVVQVSEKRLQEAGFVVPRPRWFGRIPSHVVVEPDKPRADFASTAKRGSSLKLFRKWSLSNGRTIGYR